MATKKLIIERSAKIIETSPKVLLHKNRISTLCKRVEAVRDITSNDNSSDALSMRVTDTLSAALDDILDYLTICSTKDRILANRIIINGSDEEQFVKWNEQLQHCIENLGQGNKISSLFNAKEDLQDFDHDVVMMGKLLPGILSCVADGKDASHFARLLESVKALIIHQSNYRSTYQTKTDPSAAFEMDPAKVKYEAKIGKGGKNSV